jgi:hypothetical protein
MSDCHENGVGAALVAAQGAHKGRPYKAFRAFSCHVASQKLMVSALRVCDFFQFGQRVELITKQLSALEWPNVEKSHRRSG